MNKKPQGDFNSLVYTLAKSVCLQVIGRGVKQLHSKLCEQGSPELTKEFWVPIGDQLSWEALINQI